jgi:hypothetical protein
LGKLEARRGDAQRATEHFDTAIQIFEDLDMPDRLRDCHIACAEFLYDGGDIQAAALHWKAAAEIGRLTAIGLMSTGSKLSAAAPEQGSLAR